MVQSVVIWGVMAIHEWDLLTGSSSHVQSLCICMLQIAESQLAH